MCDSHGCHIQAPQSDFWIDLHATRRDECLHPHGAYCGVYHELGHGTYSTQHKLRAFQHVLHSETLTALTVL